MEELHIKCPSCGIVLAVRNSKNEAVKRIACPNCKKQLAVTFREDIKPNQFVDIKNVPLSDGTTKTIVRALSDEHVVKINGVPLKKGDEVVLAAGDSMEIGDTVQHPSEQQLDAAPRHYRGWLLYAGMAVVMFVLCGFWLLQSRQPDLPPTIVERKSPPVDTIKEHSGVTEVAKNNEHKTVPEQKAAKKKEEMFAKKKTNISSLNNYELEKLAVSGSVEAQCLLGKRWVGRHDSINVVKGIKYLKLAAQNGSQEARTALRSVFGALQRSAASGNSTAANILREQR